MSVSVVRSTRKQLRPPQPQPQAVPRAHQEGGQYLFPSLNGVSDPLPARSYNWEMWEFDPEMIHEKYESVLERLNEERLGI